VVLALLVALAWAPSALADTARQLQSNAPTADASDAVDELVDDLVADLVTLGARISPLIIESVRVSPNLNEDFAQTLRSRITVALNRRTNLQVVHCAECSAPRARIEKGEWVVSRGITRREDLRAIAAAYEARGLLSISLTLAEEPQLLTMDAQVVRTDDSGVAFAESYRLEPQTGMLYRGVDTVATRAQKLKDLEDRIDGRVHYGQAAHLGAMIIPDEDPRGFIWGATGNYRLYEKFGPERQYNVGLNLGGFINSTRIAAAMISATVMVQLTDPNLFGPSLSIGASVGGFITGGAGNTPMGTLHIEYLFGQRIALQASCSYIIPFNLAGKGLYVGGVSPQAGMAFVW
jgi:hypothetical protein